MKKRHYILLFLIVLAIIWFAGPTPETPDYAGTPEPEIPGFSEALAEIGEKNTNIGLMPGVAHLIHLQDSVPTPYSILYLHGFSATPEEGAPTHIQLGDTFGWNLYAPLLHEHGLLTDKPLLNYTATGAWKSAVEGYRIARALGDSVIIVSTSTGAPLAHQLALRFPHVAALVDYSPNVMPADPAAFILNDHWGAQIARIVLGSDYREVVPKDDYYTKYWHVRQHIRSLPEMQELVESGFDEEGLNRLRIPVYIAAWHESDSVQDPAVSVSHMHWMFDQLGSRQKMISTFATGTHIIACGQYSAVQEDILNETTSFLIRSGKRTVVDSVIRP